MVLLLLKTWGKKVCPLMTKTLAERAANQRYSEKNKERLKENNLRYRQAHPDLCLLRAAKNRAQKYNILCTITVDDIKIPVTCPILKMPLVSKHGSYGGHDASPSLDRINPTLGYIPGNVWVISQKANAMKSNATELELDLFAQWIKKTYG